MWFNAKIILLGDLNNMRDTIHKGLMKRHPKMRKIDFGYTREMPITR